MWVKFEQGSDLGGDFWIIGEDESGHSLRWMDDLYDCSAGLPVHLPKDVVTWPLNLVESEMTDDDDDDG